MQTAVPTNTDRLSYSEQSVLLLSATVQVFNPTRPNKTEVVVLLDSGSQRSFVTEDLAKSLELSKLESEKLSISTFVTEKSRTFLTTLCQLGIKLVNGNAKIVNVSTAPRLTGNIRTIHVNSEDIAILQNQNVLTLDSKVKQPQILLGVDVVLELIYGSEIVALPSGFALIKSPLGILVAGTGKTAEACLALTDVPVMVSTLDDQLDRILQQFWKLESIGVVDSPDLTEADAALRQFEDSIKWTKGRGQLSLEG